MLVKNFTGKDLHEIMEIVSRELGSDAVILSSRKVRRKGFSGLFKPPLTEASVAYDPQLTPAAKSYRNSQASRAAGGGYTTPSSVSRRNTTTSGAGTGGGSGGSYSQGSNIAQGGNRTYERDRYAQSGGNIPGAPALRAAEERATRLLDESSEHMHELDKRMVKMENMLADFVSKFQFVKRDITYEYSPAVNDLFLKLINQQVEPELAHQLAKGTEDIIRANSDAHPAEAMEYLIIERLGQPATVTHKKFTQKVILMLGATGVGKTTTMVKLAAQFSTQQRKKVGIINTDTYRVAAHEQIKTYADILSLPLARVYYIDARADAEGTAIGGEPRTDTLIGALESMSDRELIFIDIAGKSPGDVQHREDVEGILRIARPEDVLLCVSAATGFSAMKEVADSYSYVDNYKLLVTKVDETTHCGALLNIVWYTRKPLAYITNGQSVPDDIQPFVAGNIASQLLADQPDSS